MNLRLRVLYRKKTTELKRPCKASEMHTYTNLLYTHLLGCCLNHFNESLERRGNGGIRKDWHLEQRRFCDFEAFNRRELGCIKWRAQYCPLKMCWSCFSCPCKIHTKFREILDLLSVQYKKEKRKTTLNKHLKVINVSKTPFCSV